MAVHSFTMGRHIAEIARKEKTGKIIYPENLPQPRGNGFVWCMSVILCLLLLMIFMYTGSDFKHVFLDISFWICVCGVAEVIYRASHLWEERNHIVGRYNRELSKLFKNVVYLNKCSFVVVVTAVVTTVTGFRDNNYQDSTYQCALIVLCVYLFVRWIKMDECPLNDSITLERMQPLDYGSGMALNYFYGYLRLVLPSLGDKEKGLTELIDDFIAREQLHHSYFPVKKLFILIPASTYLPSSLQEASYDWMIPIGKLEKRVRTRAGVIERKYSTSVYKIQDPNNPESDYVYVAAEGATPLKTLSEVIMFSGEKKKFFKEHKKAIIFSFYETLLEIFEEHKECRDVCELLYYVDIDEYDGNLVNAGKHILNRIKEIENRRNFLQHGNG